ncbi:MAG TPA: hypothetical protein VGX03_13120 [Candidatus Binatia bacterium]|jgi:hypothetical protein|nr:hypothetical protein [Candidatus Binatia bacterium]
MTAEEFRRQVEFENGLVPGAVVEARWTNSYNFFVAPAEVVRVNRASLRVRLLRVVKVPGWSEYPAGHGIILPRVWTNERWSANNGAFPNREDFPNEKEILEHRDAGPA